MFWTSHFWNILWLNIMFWMPRFWNNSCFEHHISETFQILNVMFLKHFMFWTLCFWNILCLECHISKAAFEHLNTLFVVLRHIYAEIQLKSLYKGITDDCKEFCLNLVEKQNLLEKLEVVILIFYRNRWRADLANSDDFNIWNIPTLIGVITNQCCRAKKSMIPTTHIWSILPKSKEWFKILQKFVWFTSARRVCIVMLSKLVEWQLDASRKKNPTNYEYHWLCPVLSTTSIPNLS